MKKELRMAPNLGPEQLGGLVVLFTEMREPGVGKRSLVEKFQSPFWTCEACMSYETGK